MDELKQLLEQAWPDHKWYKGEEWIYATTDAVNGAWIQIKAQVSISYGVTLMIFLIDDTYTSTLWDFSSCGRFTASQVIDKAKTRLFTMRKLIQEVEEK